MEVSECCCELLGYVSLFGSHMTKFNFAQPKSKSKFKYKRREEDCRPTNELLRSKYNINIDINSSPFLTLN